MAKKKSHPDVEFQTSGLGGRDVVFREFDEAVVFAVHTSLGDGTWTGVYIIIRSEAGARWWGGEPALEQYRSDPEASVFEKINVKATSEGMIP